MRGMLGVVAATVFAAVLAAPQPAPAQEQDGGKTRRARDPIAGMIEHRAELGLTDDQVARLEAVHERYREQHKALREQIHQIIGDQPKPAPLEGASREERREARRKRHEELVAQHPELGPIFDQLKANHQAAREEVKAILTPEQQQKLQQMHKEWRDRAGRGAERHGGAGGTN